MKRSGIIIIIILIIIIMIITIIVKMTNREVILNLGVKWYKTEVGILTLKISTDDHRDNFNTSSGLHRENRNHAGRLDEAGRNLREGKRRDHRTRTKHSAYSRSNNSSRSKTGSDALNNRGPSITQCISSNSSPGPVSKSQVRSCRIHSFT